MKNENIIYIIRYMFKLVVIIFLIYKVIHIKYFKFDHSNRNQNNGVIFNIKMLINLIM